jgi:hypothetical protein
VASAASGDLPGDTSTPLRDLDEVIGPRLAQPDAEELLGEVLERLRRIVGCRSAGGSPAASPPAAALS